MSKLIYRGVAYDPQDRFFQNQEQIEQQAQQLPPHTKVYRGVKVVEENKNE